MKTLSIDIETYSSVDLTKSGVYKYTQNDFEILLIAYAYDDEEIKIIDLKNNEKIPAKLKEDILDENIIKTAFNANFERVCLSKYFNTYLSPKMFRCTQVHALYLGLPHGLDNVAKSLRLKEQKLEEGKSLIRFFMKKENLDLLSSNSESSKKEEAIKKYEEFKKYCINDVRVERSIRNVLEKVKLPESEQKLWELDQEINDRGVLVDSKMLNNAIYYDDYFKNTLIEKLKNITNINNPKSNNQMKDYLNTLGIKVNSLNKESVESLLNSEEVQNLPQNKISNLDEVREKIRKDIIEYFPSRKENPNINLNLYNDENLSSLLSQLIRTTFIPKKNHRFIIADFSAIEARIIAYLSNEKWRIDVFNTHGKIYEASAAKMFKVDINEITKESELRQKGKIAELALGYQGGIGALVSMGAYNMNLCESELIEIVKAFRNSNSNIVKLWNSVEKAFIEAVKNKSIVHIDKDISFIYEGNILFIKLPSGRRLSYIRPKIDYNNSFNKNIITYEGVDSTTKKSTRLTTYGGKLVENIVQAIARDVLGEAMINLKNHGFNIVMHVHDEIVLEVENKVSSIDEVCEIMCKENRYLKGLNLKADGFESKYYKK